MSFRDDPFMFIMNWKYFCKKNLTQLSSIQYLLKFIHHLSTIYINLVITVYLINVGLGGLGEDACVCAHVY